MTRPIRFPMSRDEWLETISAVPMQLRLQLPAWFLSTTVRSDHLIENIEAETIGDITKHTEEQLKRYRNFGDKALADLQLHLAKAGLLLRSEQRSN